MFGKYWSLVAIVLTARSITADFLILQRNVGRWCPIEWDVARSLAASELLLVRICFLSTAGYRRETVYGATTVDLEVLLVGTHRVTGNKH